MLACSTLLLLATGTGSAVAIGCNRHAKVLCKVMDWSPTLPAPESELLRRTPAAPDVRRVRLRDIVSLILPDAFYLLLAVAVSLWRLVICLSVISMHILVSRYYVCTYLNFVFAVSL